MTFAIISHFAFCFGLGIPFDISKGSLFNKTSVLFPLSLSVLLISIFKSSKIKDSIKVLSIPILCALTFVADWSSIALMMPFFLYQHREDKTKQVIDYVVWISVYTTVYVFFIDKFYGFLQLATLLSLPLLLNYTGQKGGGRLSKWFFYYYFPIHLAIIGILRILIHGDISLVF